MLVISHPTPISCIQVPVLEMVTAIHRALNSAWRKGLHMDEEEDITAFSDIDLLV